MTPKIHKIALNVRATAEEKAAEFSGFRRSYPTNPKIPIETLLENEQLWKTSQSEPVFLSDVGLEFYFKKRGVSHGYIYQDCWYLVEGKFNDQQRKLLILEYADRERRYFEKLWGKFMSESAREASQPVDRISEEVKIAVWRRDKGRCVDCKERERLEYHHIIPRSKGGSSTVRNVELLCEICNRKRGNRIDELPLTF